METATPQTRQMVLVPQQLLDEVRQGLDKYLEIMDDPDIPTKTKENYIRGLSLALRPQLAWQEQKTQVFRTLCLMRSMIACGEKFTQESTKDLNLALAALKGQY